MTTTKDTTKLLEQCKKDALQRIQATVKEGELSTNYTNFPQFAWSELVLGKVLGKGGFGTVWEVKQFKIDRKDEGEDSRSFLANHCIRDNEDGRGGDCRYAVKKLSPEIVANPGLFRQGIIDLGIETHFLSDIEHPNIVKMRAIGNSGFDSQDYFIVMDRLYDTLDKRIEKWSSRSKKLKLGGRLFDRKGKKKGELYEEQIVAAYDLADAVKYLHKKDILYRDLKPENVAFDVRNDIKLFDFGLSKSLANLDKNDDGTYNLTGLTGSVRYMAPEVANEKPYNHTCDVYAFSILFWQMLVFEEPYAAYTPKSMRENVYNGRCSRPKVDPNWSHRVKTVLKRSWCPDPLTRISMEQVTQHLHEEAASARDGNEEGLEHFRRRSTFVFRQK